MLRRTEELYRGREIGRGWGRERNRKREEETIREI
jgi:hypothetical protein